MIGTRLNLVLLMCAAAVLSACEKGDSDATQQLKKDVKTASIMAANLWCKGDGYYSDRNLELITYMSIGKISAYSVRKKPDPRQSIGYRLVAFRKTADDRVDYPYILGADHPAKDADKTLPPYRLEIRGALRKDWQETRLIPLVPEEVLRSQPGLELVLRSSSGGYYKTTSVYHPCGFAGTPFYEFLNRDESIVNLHLLSLTDGRGLNARDNANADRLLELEWPVHEFALTQEYLSGKRLCTVTSSYRGLDVVVHMLQPDGTIKISTINWENNKGKVTTVTPATDSSALGSLRARWELKNSTLRMFGKSSQPWDAIGSPAIWNVRGYQDGSGRALLGARGERGADTVNQLFQDCERFRNPATGGLTFGSLNLTGDNTKDALELLTGSENLYQDLAVSRRN